MKEGTRNVPNFIPASLTDFEKAYIFEYRKRLEFQYAPLAPSNFSEKIVEVLVIWTFGIDDPLIATITNNAPYHSSFVIVISHKARSRTTDRTVEHLESKLFPCRFKSFSDRIISETIIAKSERLSNVRIFVPSGFGSRIATTREFEVLSKPRC